MSKPPYRRINITRRSHESVYLHLVLKLGALHRKSPCMTSISADASMFSGHDMTTEAALANITYLFSHFEDVEEVKRLLGTDLVGELTI